MFIAGCSSGDRTYKVSGTVRFTDGGVPQGEICLVRFEPVGGGAGTIAKGASGDIQPDGTFELTTIQPGDGAFPGEYKVVFSIWKTYANREPLVPEQYESADTTPFTVTVDPKGKNEFTFELEPL